MAKIASRGPALKRTSSQSPFLCFSSSTSASSTLPFFFLWKMLKIHLFCFLKNFSSIITYFTWSRRRKNSSRHGTLRFIAVPSPSHWRTASYTHLYQQYQENCPTQVFFYWFFLSNLASTFRETAAWVCSPLSSTFAFFFAFSVWQQIEEVLFIRNICRNTGQSRHPRNILLLPSVSRPRSIIRQLRKSEVVWWSTLVMKPTVTTKFFSVSVLPSA